LSVPCRVREMETTLQMRYLQRHHVCFQADPRASAPGVSDPGNVTGALRNQLYFVVAPGTVSTYPVRDLRDTIPESEADVADQYLDCKGLKCPMHIVAVNQAAKKLSDGDMLTVEATDEIFERDIRAWADKSGNEVVDFQDGPVKKVIIRRREKQRHIEEKSR